MLFRKVRGAVRRPREHNAIDAYGCRNRRRKLRPVPRLPTPHGDAVMLLALLSSLVEARSMGSEVCEAAVRVGKRRKTCIGRPFVTVLQARQRHARTPAPWVHAGTGLRDHLALAACAESVFTAQFGESRNCSECN